jgi:hypothetical protein
LLQFTTTPTKGGEAVNNNLIAIGNWQTFLTLKGEKLLMVIRKHPFVVIMPVLAVILFTTFFIIGGFVVFDRFLSSFPMLLTSTLLLISTALAVIAKLIIDWYFHIYLLTNRKILEFRYTPLASYIVNDVMLDRVYCTEVDFQTKGLLHDLLDLGDIIITFDRPTHQEEFTISDIKSCSIIGNYLTQQLLDGKHYEPINPIWFPGHNWGKR